MIKAKITEVQGYINDGIYIAANDELDNTKSIVNELNAHIESIKTKLIDTGANAELIDAITNIQTEYLT